jgi:hypothetical protein
MRLWSYLQLSSGYELCLLAPRHTGGASECVLAVKESRA